ncbi:MAG: GrpB family protein [bacterium]|nr:GrpB family protein [bacterium]MCP5069693.1 GrpB family protein [bacterium]
MAASAQIRLVNYDSDWPRLFEEERNRLLDVLGRRVLVIEHIGSTAIPGMPAKPILDLLALVEDIQAAPACYAPLQAIGYQYHPELEAMLPGRRYFCRYDPADPIEQTHHLHMVQMKSEFHMHQLLFRDHLTEHPEDAARYQALKQELAARFRHDREAYTDGKTAFVREILARAGGDG